MKHVDGIKILDTRSNFKILAVTYITRGSLEECVCIWQFWGYEVISG